MERPGSLFVCENTVEHMSWGPPLAAQNMRRINKEKAFTPLGLKKRLHGMTDLTGSISEKWGRGIFFFCLSSYTGLPKGRVILLRCASKQAKTKLAPVRACVRFCGPGRRTTPARPQTRAVGTVWGSCGRIQKTEEPQAEQNPAPPPLGGGVTSF